MWPRYNEMLSVSLLYFMLCHFTVFDKETISYSTIFMTERSTFCQKQVYKQQEKVKGQH